MLVIMLSLLDYRQYNRRKWLSRLVSFDYDYDFSIVRPMKALYLLKCNGITPMIILNVYSEHINIYMICSITQCIKQLHRNQ